MLINYNIVNIMIYERGTLMKIKKDFMLREIVGTWIVVPLGERVVDFNGMVTLNETGALY
jgi:hypothetical protein